MNFATICTASPNIFFCARYYGHERSLNNKKQPEVICGPAQTAKRLIFFPEYLFLDLHMTNSLCFYEPGHLRWGGVFILDLVPM